MDTSTKQLKLYHGEIIIGYKNTHGAVGSFRDGFQHFVGESKEDVLKRNSEFIEELKRKHLGKPATFDQNSDREYTFSEINPRIFLTEVSVPGFNISLEKIVDTD